MKCLILKTSSLGDLIHTFDALHTLRTHFPSPHHTIDWLVEERYAELIEAHPEVDTVYKIQTRSPFAVYKALKSLPAYDVIFDLQANIKSGLILSQLKSKKKVGFGWQTVSEWPNLLFTNEKVNPPPRQNVREDLAYIVRYALKLDPIKTKPPLLRNSYSFTPPLPGSLLVCPGSLWKNKRLPLKKLAHFVNQMPQEIVYILQGSEAERVDAEELSALLKKEAAILPKMPLPALQHFMDKVEMVVAMDSLPLHLAGTTNTQTFSFFGPSLGRTFAPEGAPFAQGPCPYGVAFDRRCPHLRTCKTGACIKIL